MSAVTHTHLSSYLADFLRRGEETAFVHTEGFRTVRWSYARVARAAAGFAAELTRRGVAKGDRIMLWGASSPEWVAAFFGIQSIGAVAVPLDLASTADFLSRTSAQTAAKLIVIDPARRTGLTIETPIFPMETLADLSAEPSPAADLKDTDIAQIIYTSGTTAEPKGVVLTHANLLVSLVNIEKEIGKYIRYERPFHPVRFLCTLPLSHVFGQMMGMLIPQLLGGEVHFHDALLPSRMIEVIHEDRISVLVTVPRIIELVREEIEAHAASIADRIPKAEGIHFFKRWWLFRDVHRRFGWKFWAIISGGATLPRETEQFWQRMGYAVIQGYGMTETASLVSVNHPFKLSKGSIGQVMPGREIRLSKDGEILVRGANVSPGYWQGDGQVVASRDEEGWLRTGDIGELDEKGNLFFKGRTKDVIVTAAGTNIYPEDLEAALNSQPGVVSSTVVGIDGPQGPEPVAALMLSDGTDGAAALQAANAQLAAHQQMRRWVRWPEPDFPRTSTRKVIRRIVAQRVQAALGGPTTTSVTSDALLAIIARISGSTPTRTTSDANLTTDLGLDSLGRMQLIAELEDRYQIRLDETAFTASTTLGDVQRLLRTDSTPLTVNESVAEPTTHHVYPEWPLSWPIRVWRWLWLQLMAMPAVVLFAHPRIRGAANLASLKGPVLFVSNHQTQNDAGLIIYALPRRMRWRLAIAMSGEMLTSMRRPPASMSPLRRWYEKLCYYLVISIFNVYPLPQRSGFRQSFAHAGRLMDRGYSTLVFPEGRRAHTEDIDKFQNGIGMLAHGLACQVVPIHLSGTAKMRSENRLFAHPGEIKITIGAPLTFPPDATPQQSTAALESAVRSLVDQED